MQPARPLLQPSAGCKEKNGWELESDLQAAKIGVSLANVDIDEAEGRSGISNEHDQLHGRSTYARTFANSDDGDMTKLSFVLDQDIRC